MTPAQIVAFEAACDLRTHLEAGTFVDAAIDHRVDQLATVEEARKLMGNLYRAAGVRACRVCGCTEEEACADGCIWVEQDLCSECRRKQ